MLSHEQLIATLNLEPHFEGGHFKRIFNSDQASHDGRRFAASIYYLLKDAEFSCFHRIDADELWHFYAGETMTVHQILPDGNLVQTVIGNILENPSAVPFLCVKQNTWFAAEVTKHQGMSLVGCTTIPEFQSQQFEEGSREQLNKLFPQHKELIARFTRK